MGILETCGPNEAMVKTGFCTGVKITAGGFMLNIPCLQQIRRLDLTVMTVYVDSTDVVTAEGVPVSAHSVVQTRIDPFPENAGADAVAGNQVRCCLLLLPRTRSHGAHCCGCGCGCSTASCVAAML